MALALDDHELAHAHVLDARMLMQPHLQALRERALRDDAQLARFRMRPHGQPSSMEALLVVGYIMRSIEQIV
ncbi:hypothetical protein D3C72_1907380 [compost metagenome]